MAASARRLRRWRPPRIAQWQSSAATTHSRQAKGGWSPRWTSLRPATASCGARLDEARLRGAPLHVLTTWQSRFTDVHDGHAVADGNRLAKAQLDRRLAQWKKRYPELDVQAVAVHGNTLNYIAKNASSIQLLVVGHERGARNHGTGWAARQRGAARHRLFCVDLRTAERIVSSTWPSRQHLRRASQW